MIRAFITSGRGVIITPGRAEVPTNKIDREVYGLILCSCQEMALPIGRFTSLSRLNNWGY